MSTDFVKRGRFTARYISDSELPKDFLQTSISNLPSENSKPRLSIAEDQLDFDISPFLVPSTIEETKIAFASALEVLNVATNDYLDTVEVVSLDDVEAVFSRDERNPVANVTKQILNEKDPTKHLMESLDELIHSAFLRKPEKEPDSNVSEPVASTSSDFRYYFESESGVMTGARRKDTYLNRKIEAISSDDSKADKEDKPLLTDNRQTTSTETPASTELQHSTINESTGQPTGCCRRCGRSYRNLSNSCQNSNYWLVFLCLLFALPFLAVTVGEMYKNKCKIPFDISTLVVAKGVLGFLTLLCHLVTVSLRRFAPSRSSQYSKAFTLISITLLLILMFLEVVLVFPDVDISGDSWITYNYIYLSVATLVFIILSTSFHLDLSYDACVPGIPCVSCEQTET
ncbi:hypothetical protein NPIL_100311 [Nephila pilipes]|uniref:Uncharacterized protein n=1 Tax=Nephila pilipes TaxID=299642 RepID=A0A8X6T3B0_NEPPI|nr:hypothetical protein NPIL_100311 [Nephila pilipes]